MKKIFSMNSICLLFLSLALFTITAFGFKGNKKIYTQSSAKEKRANADMETLRKRVVDDLLQPPVDASEIKRLVQTIQPDGSWPGINYKDTTKTGFEHRIHLENMLELARAYRKTGSPYQRNADVKKTLSSALDFWIAHDFICENWWWNEMGTPNLMINTLLVFDTDLTDKQRTEGARIASRASLTGFGARAGGDFVPIAGMVCKQGLFKRDDSILQKAIKVMTDQVVITPARGINPDMGFHHRVDNVTSIHTYGTNYVSAFSYWAVKTEGTKYSLPPKALNLLIDYYVDGISKCMAYGIYPDPGARNRDLSRKGEAAHAAGTELPQNLARSSNYRKQELEYLIKVRKGEIKPTLTWDKYFWHSSYLAHQSKNYYAGVRMHSSRQNNMEEPYNEEGLKMHHIADGGNFLSRTGKEYADIFPVWDWQKIPGTTVVQRPTLPPPNQIAKKGLSDFVGAVSDGQLGVAAFDFKSVHDPLTARKAWFFFDREYVCLGTAIKSGAEYPVATTINQCLLNGKVVVKTNNAVQTLDKGKHNLENVAWVMHDSVAYIFPSPVTINVSNATASGSWKDITHQTSASAEQVQEDLFTLWYDHGQKPQSASYAYIVVPSIASSSIDGYTKAGNIQIVANTEDIQAVHNKGLNISEVAFYKAGSIKLANNITLTAASPCLVMVEMKGSSISKIAVSDPTQKLASLQLKVNAPVNGSGETWKSTYDSKNKLSTLEVDLPKEGLAGKSVVMEMVSAKK